jgi:enediyne biosynthesis protein E5
MKKFRFPRDGRYYIFINHIILITLGFTVFHFQRTLSQLVVGLIGALLTETIASLITKKAKGRQLWDRWLSASVASLSLFILISTPSTWFYFVGSAIAILSKYVFRIDRDRHMFNPSGFAIVVLLAILPSYFFRVYGDEFNLNTYLIIQVLFFGILATAVSNRWMMSLSYMLMALFLSIFLSAITDHGFVFFLGPELSANGLLFIWLMMPDPRTTPDSRKMQVIIGCSIAALNLFLRNQEVIYGQFISLFTICAIRTFIFSLRRPSPV